MTSFDGSLIENIERFREILTKYNEEIERKKKSVKHRIINALEIRRIRIDDKWHLKVLDGRRVVGVDGSQIAPLRELGIPIGVIQTARIWVIHGRGEFGKSYRTTLVRIEENIDLKRFQLELEMLMEEMDGKSWLFFDGSLMPYAVEQSVREKLTKIVSKVIEMSEETQTPIIGYIDKSFSKDIAMKFGLDIYDVFLLSDVMDIFSYTQPFGNKICYAYLMVNPSMPVRIEYPEWMRDMHDEVIRIVFAECLLGKTRGYPYILERAHHYSCIDAKARASFMKAVKSYGVSFKWISKIR